MNSHADKTLEDKSQSVADASSKKSNSVSTFQFVDNRPDAIAQRKLQEMANNSPQVSQLRALQKMANNSPLSVSSLPKGFGVLQRAINVSAEERVGSVVINTSGYAPEFEGGDDAKNNGWNGVEKYKAEAKVGDNASITLGETSNDYLVAQAGHVLAKQNGGIGSDPDNVFAQDGGVNNGPFRTNFENPMRIQLNAAAEDDDVNFRVVLYGKNITQGPLEKESDRLEASEEESDFEGF